MVKENFITRLQRDNKKIPSQGDTSYMGHDYVSTIYKGYIVSHTVLHEVLGHNHHVPYMKYLPPVAGRNRCAVSPIYHKVVLSSPQFFAFLSSLYCSGAVRTVLFD